MPGLFYHHLLLSVPTPTMVATITAAVPAAISITTMPAATAAIPATAIMVVPAAWAVPNAT
ncbi:MAG: hypothetical protein KGH91_02900 [Rhodospirillales bacterium]|nr:hypothetical protein [Rhodospirillales bacterium]